MSEDRGMYPSVREMFDVVGDKGNKRRQSRGKSGSNFQYPFHDGGNQPWELSPQEQEKLLAQKRTELIEALKKYPTINPKLIRRGSQTGVDAAMEASRAVFTPPGKNGAK